MFNILVSVDELAAHLDDPHWIVFDCRHDLVDTESGRRAYAQSHVPGARFLHLDEDLSGAKTGANGRHPLPDPAWFCARLSALGMDNGKQAIAYDASGGFYAARLWWMLGWVGHAGAAVLDGGWNAWSNAKHPFKAHAPTITPGVFDGAARDYTLTADAVRTGLRQSRICLIDARAPDRFRGE